MTSVLEQFSGDELEDQGRRVDEACKLQIGMYYMSHACLEFVNLSVICCPLL